MPSVASPGLAFADLEARAAAMDALAGATPGIDRFCSGAAWSLAAREAFAPDAEPVIVHDDAGMIALMRTLTPEGVPLLAPLEASWGLACPLLGAAPEPLAARLAALAETPPNDRLPVVIMGMPRLGPLLAAVLVKLGAHRVVRPAPDTVRVIADLTAGVDAYLQRRGAHFRAAVRRAERAGARAGLELETVDPTTPEAALALIDRALAVEARSWKGLAGTGLVGTELEVFTRGLVRRIAPSRALRGIVLRRGDADVGFIVGAVAGATYRGLQASFVTELRRLSPGMILHVAMMRRLAAEGVTRYDLGSDMEYKRRWGDPGLVTSSVVALPRLERRRAARPSRGSR